MVFDLIMIMILEPVPRSVLCPPYVTPAEYECICHLCLTPSSTSSAAAAAEVHYAHCCIVVVSCLSACLIGDAVVTVMLLVVVCVWRVKNRRLGEAVW